jgi:hypothetical protein
MMMRGAMKGLVPDLITERNDKGVFNELFDAGLITRESARVLQALGGELAERPYVRTERLHEEVETYSRNAHPWWGALWRAVTAGLWLQSDVASRGQRSDRVSMAT